MNIKIVIKDSDSNPAIVTKNTLSEVQHKKKNMLYEAPSNQKKIVQSKKQKNKKNQEKQRQLSEGERKMMNDLDRISKNQASLDMIHNSNNILQKQNQILENNQRSINNMIKNSQNGKNIKGEAQQQTINALKIATQKVTKQVEEIKKIRDQIVNVGKQVSKALGEAKQAPQNFKIPPQISDMNKNIKNLTEISHNHLQGLQNLQALKNLQNFNVEVYMQQVNTLKKQILQYQKQSENIQRQLRLRAAKLEKLELPKNIEHQILQPYNKHLRERADSIDLHQIKDNVYAKLGIFDYSLIESDINHLINEARSQVSDFYIVCKQHQIQVPSIKINPKEFKNLDVKFPSVLDEYKQSRGINFKQKQKKNEEESNNNNSPNKTADKLYNTGKQKKYINRSPQNMKDRDRLRNLASKPIDLATQVRLTNKDNLGKQTILKDHQKERTQKNIKQERKNIKNRKQDEDFDKYLENRRREELQALYREKKEKLERMQKELYDQCIQPTYINLNINPHAAKITQHNPSYGRISINHILQKNSREHSQIIESKKQIQKTQPQHSIKQIGKEVLKEKLIQIMKKNQNKHQTQPNIPPSYYPSNIQIQSQAQVGNLAEGIVNLINNTLTQVNANLAKNIERRMDVRRSAQIRQPSKSPIRIQSMIPVPKLQQFRAPPVFTYNNPIYQQPHQPIPQALQQKIIQKDYQHLKISNTYDDLRVSMMQQ